MEEEDIQKKNNDDVDVDDVQSQIQTAMRSRVPHFKQQAEFVSLSLIPNNSLSVTNYFYYFF
jgi:hypothetical protein